MKIHVLTAIAVLSMCNQSGAEPTKPSRDRIAVGMSFDRAMQLLKAHKCEEVAKDVPPPTRCFVVAEHRALYVTPGKGTVVQIMIEDGADQPKAFRTHRKAESYDLP